MTSRTITEPILTSDESLATLERLKNRPKPTPPIPPEMEALRGATLQLSRACVREHTWRPEVTGWFGIRPVESVYAALGLDRGAPLASAFMPIMLVDEAVDKGQRLLRVPQVDDLERLATQLQAADDPAVIGRLTDEIQQIAVTLRQSRDLLASWRATVQSLESEMRRMASASLAWIEASERARGTAPSTAGRGSS